MDRDDQAIHRILETGTDIVRRCKETAGTAGSAAGYKGRQIEALKQFATESHLWLDMKAATLTFISQGGENDVFYDSRFHVLKLNNFEYAGDDLDNFFTRIRAHNRFFSNVPYELVGFAYNREEEFCAVLRQPYVRALREATPAEIQTCMEALGFIMDYPDEYHNAEYEVFDAVPNNVLYGIDGHLYFIDTQIRRIPTSNQG